MSINTQLLFTINALARSTPWLQPFMAAYATVGGLAVFTELMFIGWWIARRREDLTAVAAALWTPLGGRGGDGVRSGLCRRGVSLRRAGRAGRWRGGEHDRLPPGPTRFAATAAHGGPDDLPSTDHRHPADTPGRLDSGITETDLDARCASQVEARGRPVPTSL